MEYPSPPEQPVALPGWYPDAAGQMRWWDGTRWADPAEQKPDTTWPMFSHLSWFLWPIICPLLVRVTRGKRDLFSKHHSAEALNAHLTFLVVSLALLASGWLTAAYAAGSSATNWPFVAFLIWLFAGLVWTVLSIAGAVHARQGTWWRYPFSIRFVPGAVKTPPVALSDAAAPPPHIPDSSSSKRVTFILLGVLAGLAILGGVVASVTVAHGTTAVSDLTPGDCVKTLPPDSQLVGTLDTVACEETHAAEVFAVLTMPDGDFPGESAVKAYSDNCGNALMSYAPHATTENITLVVLYPTAASWPHGDRSLTCIAAWDSPRAGSIRG